MNSKPLFFEGFSFFAIFQKNIRIESEIFFIHEISKSGRVLIYQTEKGDTKVGRVSDINRENFAKSLITVSKKKQLILAFTPSEYSTEIRKYFDASVVSSYNKMISVDEEITRQEV